MDVKHHVTRGAGLIDADFRGEIKVLLVNRGDEDYQVLAGDRIAQLVITLAFPDTVVEVQDLPPTGRGEGGFGSTGK